MDLCRLYEHSDKMLNDDILDVQVKRALLSEWKTKFEAKVGTTILSSSDLYDVCEFIAHIKLRLAALDQDLQ